MNDDGSNDPLDKAVSGIAADGLAKYLMDADLSRAAVDYLHTDLGIPKLGGKLFVRGLAQLVEWSAKVAGSEISAMITARLRPLPYFSKLERGLGKLTANLKGELEKAAEGPPPRHDEEFAKRLTESLKDSLESLATSEGLRESADRTIAEIIARLAPQPKLRLSLSDAESDGGLNRFFYGSRKTAFVGREGEMARLDGFLDDTSAFRWWLVHGPAGFGKSRLALELCLKRGGSWRVGFLLYEHKAGDVDRWIPDEPTLLVADYASGQERAQELGRTIRDLSATAGDFPFPVRLLLLERDAGDWWLDRLRGVGGERLETDKNRHDEHMALGGLSDDGVRCIFEAFGLTGDQAAERLPVLRKMDPEGRPLFAALMGDAVDGDRLQLWRAKEDLIGDVMAREEEKFWRPAGVTDADKVLLALATLCGGLDLKDLNALPEGPGLLGNYNAKCLRIMSGRDARERLAALEPDILGEWFVLDYLKPKSVLDQRLADMRTLAWRLAPFAMALFVDRASQDFPGHGAFKTLAMAPDGENKPAVFLWTMAAVNLINRLAASDPDAARGWYGDIKTLSAENPEAAALRVTQAQAAVNLINGLAASDPGAARGWYGEIKTLATQNPEDAALRELQAKAAVNLISGLAASDPDAARGWYAEIKTLSTQNPEQPALREAQAKAAMNLIGSLGASDPGAARGWYAEIKTLSAKNPEQPALREEQAKAVVNLINHLGTSDPGAARGWYGDIETLAAENPEDAALRELQATAAMNLIANLAASDPGAARGWYGEIKTLSASHPGEPALREAQSKAAMNLINRLGASDPDAAWGWYGEIKILSASHPGEPALREAHASAAMNLTNRLGASDPGAARGWYAEIKTLSAQNPEDAALRVTQAKAAMNLIYRLGASDPGAARGWYAEIKTLSAQNPEVATLRVTQAQAAMNLITRLGASDPGAARGWYAEIKTLSDENPEDAALRESQAQAAFNFFVAYMKSGDKAGAKKMAKDVFRLAEENPGLPICREAAERLHSIIREAEEE